MPKYQPLLEKAYDRKDKEEVMSLYSDWAEHYDDELGDNEYVAPQRAAALFAEYVPDRTVHLIDIGCGTGLVGRFLVAHGFENIDGLDLSADMLAQAGKTGIYKKLIQADLTAGLKIADATYDAVISVGTFTHNHVGPQGLDEVLRIVKPGAIAGITVNGDAYVEDGYRAKFDQLVKDGICTIVNERDEDYIIARSIRGRVVTLKKT
ncbi:MAG: class I SAM-dependent methyltransferase [Rhodospirillales bacterium]|nr:class I SAM-dependent methyltransferase [Rhodospirillales bacterium]